MPFSSLRFTHRFTARERLLLLLTAGAVFFIVNILLVNYLLRRHHELGADLATRQQEFEATQILLKDASIWDKRAEWLQTHQPNLANTQRAGVELLNQIQQFARQAKVVLESPQVNPPETGAAAASNPATVYRQSVSVTVVVKGDWASVIRFLASLQQNPETFLVLENATLRSDPSDATQMRAELRIAKWYAPAAASG